MLIKLTLINLFFTYSSFASINFIKHAIFQYKLPQKQIANSLTMSLKEGEELPKEVNVLDRKLQIYYSLDPTLENNVLKILKMYRSDYASVVIVDNNTGKILTALDYGRRTGGAKRQLALTPSSPAASVFKVITAADVIENGQVDLDTEFYFSGKSTTLYKYQLKQNRHNRWIRSTTFQKAFATSNNPVFAKAALNNSDLKSISRTATKFGFEKDLLPFIQSEESQLFEAETSYQLAELASGFNRHTLISPLHGAVIASIIANDGYYKKPSLVTSIVDEEKEELLWVSKYKKSRAIKEETSQKLKQMMGLTIQKGTARSAFNLRRDKKLREFEIGGKTGTITGGEPHGKRDWFISYAKPKGDKDKGISVSVMLINVDKWYVKAPFLAKQIIKSYYQI